MKKRKAINFDYRHIICILITLGFLSVSFFVFQDALGRIIESFRDFGLSVAFIFCELFGIENNIQSTVNSLPKVPYFPNYGGENTPITSLPDTWGGFKTNFVSFWKLWASKDNFFAYLSSLAPFLETFLKVLVILILFIIIGVILFKNYLRTQNNKYNIDTKFLKAFKKLSRIIYHPVKNWILSFVDFVKNHKAYWIIWLCSWLYNFNLFTIVIEFFAFFFYFAATFEFSSIYFGFYKLGLDLWAMLSFVPLWCWIIIGVVILEVISRKVAYNRLVHRERRNRGFINEREIVTFVAGKMGVGKTLQITDMALSSEVQFRDQAFEIILETDMKFPYFPWINFENAIKKGMEDHSIIDLWTCRSFVRESFEIFAQAPSTDNLFDYDFELYGLEYDDNLKVISLFEALEDYACAYFIYIIQSSLLISNYSIRSDMLFQDLGNFPLWNANFFKRDSRLIDSYSRHSHILDFDMLRLGKQMVEDNPNANAFGFGVYVISEIDKERKNTPELKEVKSADKECNQKNDLFNSLVKMSRHACVVANRVFIRIFGDFQRPQSLGADCLELGEVIYIKNKGERTSALPFFSPFYLLEGFCSWINGKFENFYTQYRFNRADNTLFLHVLKTISSKLKQHCERQNNLFGSQVLKIQVEDGVLDGDKKDAKYYRQSKKIYSKRYSTDCLSGIFEERSRANMISLQDLAEYADIIATKDELDQQNSHFQNDINKLRSK